MAPVSGEQILKKNFATLCIQYQEYGAAQTLAHDGSQDKGEVWFQWL